MTRRPPPHCKSEANHNLKHKKATRTDASLFFFFQAEDGIRDLTVTGVQTCALPISIVPIIELWKAMKSRNFLRFAALVTGFTVLPCAILGLQTDQAPSQSRARARRDRKSVV